MPSGGRSSRPNSSTLLVSTALPSNSRRATATRNNNTNRPLTHGFLSPLAPLARNDHSDPTALFVLGRGRACEDKELLGRRDAAGGVLGLAAETIARDLVG